jgi:hypothetical protein
VGFEPTISVLERAKTLLEMKNFTSIVLGCSMLKSTLMIPIISFAHGVNLERKMLGRLFY